MSPLDEAAFDSVFNFARSHPIFADRAVDGEVLQELTRLVMLTPTAFNQQPLRVLYVASDEARVRLAGLVTAGNRAKVEAAPLTALLCWDMDFIGKLPLVNPVMAERAEAMFPSEEARRDSARQNALIQAGAFLVAARALGLGVGPMAGFDRAGVAEAFLAGTGWEPALLVNLGWPMTGPANPRLPRLDFDLAARVI